MFLTLTPEQEFEVLSAIRGIKEWMERICAEFDDFREHMNRVDAWLNEHKQQHVLQDATRELVNKNANLIKSNEQLLGQLEQRRRTDKIWHSRVITVGKAGWAVIIALLGGAGGTAVIAHYFHLVPNLP